MAAIDDEKDIDDEIDDEKDIEGENDIAEETDINEDLADDEDDDEDDDDVVEDDEDEDEDEDDLAIDETSDLIASNKVEGTAVYNTERERLGSIQNFMVDKHTGQVAYAVLKFGGFLGIGDDHYPLPWDALSYDPEVGGYVVDLDKETLERAPRYGDEEPLFDRLYGQQIYAAYGMTYPF